MELPTLGLLSINSVSKTIKRDDNNLSINQEVFLSKDLYTLQEAGEETLSDRHCSKLPLMRLYNLYTLVREDTVSTFVHDYYSLFFFKHLIFLKIAISVRRNEILDYLLNQVIEDGMLQVHANAVHVLMKR